MGGRGFTGPFDGAAVVAAVSPPKTTAAAIKGGVNDEHAMHLKDSFLRRKQKNNYSNDTIFSA